MSENNQPSEGLLNVVDKNNIQLDRDIAEAMAVSIANSKLTDAQMSSSINNTTRTPDVAEPASEADPKTSLKNAAMSLLGFFWKKDEPVNDEKVLAKEVTASGLNPPPVIVQPVSTDPAAIAAPVSLDGQKIEIAQVLPPVVPAPLPELVRFDQVTKIFGEGKKTKTVLKEVSFVVHDLPDIGEIIAIVGPSGCGKSTVLKNIAGLSPHYPPTAGAISLFGKPATKASSLRGVVDQKYSLFRNLTVVDNVAFGLKLRGDKRKDRIEKAMEWVKKVGLDGAEHKYPYELSGGMQQRVAIASTLVLGSRILLMDEPFGALDPKIRLEMQGLIVDLWRELEQTIFIVTHSMEEAVYLGDRVYRMGSNPGRLIEEIQIPRPDLPPQEMRKRKDFQEIVKDLTNKLERDSGL